MLDVIKNFFLSAPFAEALLIILITIVAIISTKKMLTYCSHSKQDWLKSLGQALYDPSGKIIFGYGLFTTLAALLCQNPLFQKNILQGRSIFMIAMITWILFKWKTSFIELMVTKVVKHTDHRSDKLMIDALSKLVSIAIIAVAGLMTLEVLGVPLQALAAFGGVSGIAVGWAAKDIIANFFGGLMIYINRPFIIGDWIRSDNKNFEGVVEAIGWYMTSLRTLDRRPTSVPNSLITGAIIENSGRMYNRRIKFGMGLRYEDIDKVQAVSADIEQMLRSNNEIAQNLMLTVDLVAFDPYSVNVEVYAFTKVTGLDDFRRVQQDVLLNIHDIVIKHGAQVALPTSSVKLVSEKSSE